MNYQECLAYLDSFINYEKLTSFSYGESFNLDNITNFLKFIGNLQDKFKIIHIAGTKGKGSTAAFIAYILKAANFKVGLYTSPHLSNIAERIRILDKHSSIHDEFEGLISEEKLIQLTQKLKGQMENFSQGKNNLTYFEFITALGFAHFADENVDFAVLETGLGGRLDATNVGKSLVSVITPISLEHTQYLGNSVEEIAQEKCEIIKEGSIVVAASQRDQIQKVISKKAKEVNAKVLFLGKDFSFKNANNDFSSQEFNLKLPNITYNNLEIKLRGSFQIINAAVAVAALDALKNFGIQISEDSFRSGLLNTYWPGRFELLSSAPLIIVDGAQNPLSIGALMDSIKKEFKDKRKILVLGVSSDKDIRGICELVKESSDMIILTQADSPRAASSITIEEDGGLENTRITASVKEAINIALDNAGENDLVLITGSLFVVGEAREYLKKEKLLCKS